MLCWFAETTLVAAILACVAALCGRLPGLGPSARHLLWLVVLIKLLTPPVVPSPWTVPLPAAWWSGSTERSSPEPTSAQDMLPRGSETARELPAADVAEASGPDLAAEPVDVEESVPAPRVVTSRTLLPVPGTLQEWLLAAWISGALAAGLAQLLRILRFQRRLCDAVPAPQWLIDEAGKLGDRLGVRVPEILVAPHLATPMLWCLGRPRLLVPGRLLTSIDMVRWQGILAHELAHLRRGDHWVSRLELLAGLIWFWNPVYWLARRRLDAEAELACDAWVVWALPDDRLTYAEALFQVCSDFSRATSAAPALGVAGSGRLLERRLTMILRDHVPCRVSTLTLIAAGLLTLLAVPSWTLGKAASPANPDPASSATLNAPADDHAAGQVKGDDDDRDDDDTINDDDDDDDDVVKSTQKDKHKARQDHKEKAERDAEGSDIDKKIEKAFGPDFEKKIEAMADKLAKEMEAKFGENSEFVRKMEAFGKEMEEKFGDDSEFARKMEALGKDMEKKFGPGSEFEKNIKQKLGPGSDFEKKMRALGDDMKKKFGPDSDFEKKIKDKIDSKLATTKTKVKPARPKDQKPQKAQARNQKREERIKRLESKINDLMKELKELKEEDQDGADEE